jgi:hypothetical protein
LLFMIWIMYCLFATSAGEKSLVPFGILGFDAIFF